MIIVGCDFHPSFQQVAMLDTETGATEEHKLMHTSGEAEGFYQKLASPAIVGIETVGNDQWFVQLLQKLGHEVCVGDAAHIRASYVRKQKTDRRDAKHILQLLVEGRVGVASENGSQNTFQENVCVEKKWLRAIAKRRQSGSTPFACKLLILFRGIF
jgi:Transposase